MMRPYVIANLDPYAIDRAARLHRSAAGNGTFWFVKSYPYGIFGLGHCLTNITATYYGWSVLLVKHYRPSLIKKKIMICW